MLAGLILFVRTTAADEPAPPPPAWQRDLNAALVLQAALALSPAKDPAADAERHQRLGHLYTQLVNRYPNQAEVQKAAGGYYDQTDQTDLAVSCWQRAEIIDPHDARVAAGLGSEFLRRGRVRDASEQFERAVAARPDVASYHTDLANVLYLFRNELLTPDRATPQAVLTEALRHFRRAAELNPADVHLAQAYAETFYMMPDADWQQALAAWKNVLTLSGTDTDFANGHLARVSLRLRRPDEADTYLDQIRSPAFDNLKSKFRQQTAAMRGSSTPLPTGSPTPTLQ